VAKANPGEFIRQVRAETAKVVWPTRKETITTGIMVVIMTTILAVFFFVTDWTFSTIVQFLLGLLDSRP
jgi:preprotein translocase subunit SecE